MKEGWKSFDLARYLSHRTEGGSNEDHTNHHNSNDMSTP